MEDEILITNSPEPPEPVEPDDAMQTDDFGQPGRLHPEQDLPHIFKVCASVRLPWQIFFMSSSSYYFELGLMSHVNLINNTEI